MRAPVKLLLTWDIKSGQEEDYFSFVTQEFPAILQQAGLRLTEAWYTVYGDWPQVSIGIVGDDFQTMELFLTSLQWEEAKRRLLLYTKGYHQKIVRARGAFQL
ncbi:MAG TPA: hypothetical protein PKH77_03100 [Anaerolineae bacterium]|nr:hypothetical protein [Anaerolineae bacterium]